MKPCPHPPRPKGKAPSKAITLRDIAKAAGVHVTSVSLALRNSPQLPETTRIRLQTLARRMGYRPNPLAVAFVHRRRASHPEKYQGTLAYIIRYAADFAPTKHNEFPGPLFEESRERAKELGFNMESFDLADYGNDHRRLQKVLRARGILGLLVAPLPEPAGKLEFDWSNFSSVALGQSLREPAMDCVDLDYHAASLLALHECERRGYHRAGFISMPFTDVRTTGRRRAGFLVYQTTNPSFQRLPPLIFSLDQIEKKIPEWLHRWKPDVLLANCTALQFVQPVFQKLNISIPRDFGLIETNILSPRIAASTHTQISDGWQGGRIAVDFLVSKLYRNEFGLPKHPQTILASPVWSEGDSLPWRAAPTGQKPPQKRARS